MLQEIRSYFREMNVSERLADAMLRIEPDKVRLLNEATLTSYGLTLTDPIEQETEDLEDAQSWGLDRQEYMRRKSIAGRACPIGEPDSRAQCYQTVMKTGQTPSQAPSQAGFSMTDEYSTPAAWQESNGIGRERFSFRRGQLRFNAPQDEAAFDRQMCIIVGKRGIEECVRDSALWRRGETSGAATLRSNSSDQTGAPPGTR
jgi:hypothetical protein